VNSFTAFAGFGVRPDRAITKYATLVPLHFLPFHPGTLGAAIATFWLLLPAAVAWIGGYFLSENVVSRYIALALTAVGTFAAGRLISIRFEAISIRKSPPWLARSALRLMYEYPRRHWVGASLCALIVAAYVSPYGPGASVLLVLYVFGPQLFLLFFAVVIFLIVKVVLAWRRRRRRRNT